MNIICNANCLITVGFIYVGIAPVKMENTEQRERTSSSHFFHQHPKIQFLKRRLSKYMIYKTCNKCRQKYEYGKKCSCVNKQHKQMKVIKGQDDDFYTKPAWRKLRKKILRRDCICMRCYFKFNYVNISNLEVHHIKPRSKYPELEMESTNLITLCKKCNLELGTREALDFEYEILNPIDRSYSL